MLAMRMVQYEGGGISEDRAVDENDAGNKDEDVLTRLRHLRRTLNECRWRVERVDDYLHHLHSPPTGATFFTTLPGDAFTPQTSPGDAFTPQTSPGDAFTPQTSPGDAFIDQALPGDSLGSQALPGDCLEPQAHPSDTLEPHTNFEDTLDLPVFLTDADGLDTRSENRFSKADEANTHSENTHIHSMDVNVQQIHLSDARSHHMEPITSSPKHFDASFQEDQQQKTKKEEAKVGEGGENFKEQTNITQEMMRKDPMSEVKEAEEHLEQTEWTVVGGELTEDLKSFNDIIDDVMATTVGELERGNHEFSERRRWRLKKQSNIHYEMIVSQNDLEDNQGMSDICEHQSEESKLSKIFSCQDSCPLDDQEITLKESWNEEPHSGAEHDQLSESSHKHCHTCVDFNLEKVKFFIISLQNSIGYSPSTIRRRRRNGSDEPPGEIETTTDLMGDACVTLPSTPGSSASPLDSHSQPEELSYLPLHPPSSYHPQILHHPHCSHEAHLSHSPGHTNPTHPDTSDMPTLLGRSKKDLKDSLATVIVILLLLFALIFLACCLMIVVPVVTIRNLGGPAVF